MSEKTVIKAFAMPSAAMNGSPSAVDVKDGKVIRIRSFYYDSKYTKEEIKPFEVKARGKTFKLPMKSMPPSLCFFLEEENLFSQPDQVSVEKGGLGPQWREKYSEPG